jgi:hypothetical protein
MGFVGIPRDYPLHTWFSKQLIGDFLGCGIIPLIPSNTLEVNKALECETPTSGPVEGIL